MKLKPYPKYKPSGVKWIRDIPDHWEVKRLKFVARLAYGESLPDEKREDGDFLVFGSNGVVGSHSSAVTCGPSVVIGRKGSFGKVVYTDDSCYPIDTTYFIDKRYTKSSLKWLYYLLQTLELDKFSKDSAVPGLNRESTHNKLVPYFNITEQIKIAKFLDRETSQIQNLIEEYEKLIDLLKEKRTALISQVVTKGLNPNVKMKDSGVEWIGEVPEHWEAKKLKYLTTNLDSMRVPISSEDRVKGEIPYYGATGIIDYVNSYIFDEKLLLIGEDGAPFFEKYKDVAFIINGKSWVNNHAHVLRVKDTIKSELIMHQLNITDYKFYIKGSTRDKLNQDELSKILIVVPPPEEQKQISDYLNSETSKIDTLIEKINKQIELLKEHKTSLISHVVTGKVDVRGEVA